MLTVTKTISPCRGEKPAEQVLAEEEKVKQESQEHPVPISPDIEPDDEVIAEIDVHLSQDLANYLYIVQYPLRPPWRPYDPNNLKYVHCFVLFFKCHSPIF